MRGQDNFSKRFVSVASYFIASDNQLCRRICQYGSPGLLGNCNTFMVPYYFDLLHQLI